MEELPVDPNALALAQELRAVAMLLADREVAAEVVAEVLPLARELRARLLGPRASAVRVSPAWQLAWMRTRRSRFSSIQASKRRSSSIGVSWR